MRTLVMGDIHGAHKALLQCLERSHFDKTADTLIQLGDITDGFDEVFECVAELLTIPNLIAIKGNHDEWFNEFIQTAWHPTQWRQGGFATARSYLKRIGKKDKIFPVGTGFKTALNPTDIPESHRHFFNSQRLYHIDGLNNCYIHAGFNRFHEFEGQQPENYYWNRQLWSSALSYNAFDRHLKGRHEFYMVTPFNKIFIGHTPTTNWDTDQPMRAVNIYDLDTGCGHSGRLTILDRDTQQYWQSDPVTELYGKKANARRPAE